MEPAQLRRCRNDWKPPAANFHFPVWKPAFSRISTTSQGRNGSAGTRWLWSTGPAALSKWMWKIPLAKGCRKTGSNCSSLRQRTQSIALSSLGRALKAPRALLKRCLSFKRITFWFLKAPTANFLRAIILSFWWRQGKEILYVTTKFENDFYKRKNLS